MRRRPRTRWPLGRAQTTALRDSRVDKPTRTMPLEGALQRRYLTADLATGIGCRMNVHVPASSQQVDGLCLGQRRGPLDRTRRTRERQHDAGVRAWRCRAVEVRSCRRPGKPGVRRRPGQSPAARVKAGSQHAAGGRGDGRDLAGAREPGRQRCHRRCSSSSRGTRRRRGHRPAARQCKDNSSATHAAQQLRGIDHWCLQTVGSCCDAVAGRAA